MTGNANFIRAWRKHRGKTQSQISDAITIDGDEELSNVSISRIETGKQRFSSKTLFLIAETLQCEPWQLLKGPPETGDDDISYSVLDTPKTHAAGRGADYIYDNPAASLTRDQLLAAVLPIICREVARDYASRNVSLADEVITDQPSEYWLKVAEEFDRALAHFTLDGFSAQSIARIYDRQAKRV